MMSSGRMKHLPSEFTSSSIPTPGHRQVLNSFEQIVGFSIECYLILIFCNHVLKSLSPEPRAAKCVQPQGLGIVSKIDISLDDGYVFGVGGVNHNDLIPSLYWNPEFGIPRCTVFD